MADFCLVGQRTLEDFELRLFRYHYLLGADWKSSCRALNVDRGVFFHTVYEMEYRLGRIFAELEPYPLYPLSEYFAGSTRREPQQAESADSRVKTSRRKISPLPLSA